jgi:CRP-like cAMP-binding protein
VIPQPIDQVPLFVHLSQEERGLVAARLRRRQVASGELVFTAGAPSDALFVILSGWVKLEDANTNRKSTLANLGAGSLVGEVDALLGRAYTTSARAAATTQLLVLPRADLADLITEHPTIGLKFSATLGMRVAFLEPYLVQQRLRDVELLSALAEDDLRACAQRLDFRSFTRGDPIVEAGAPGEAVFLIEEGQVRLMAKASDGESFEELNEGDLFGHTALVTGKPYPSTAYAVTDVNVWFLPRAVYQDLIREHPAIKIAFSRALAEGLGPSDQSEAIQRVSKLSLFKDMPTEALTALVGRLVLRHFPANEVIYAEGTPGDALYVVESGEVRLLDSAFSDAQLLERVRAGESFGEMALLTGRTRAECGRAANDTTVWVLYKTDFDDLMVQYPEISVSLSRALSDRLASRENDFVVRHLRRMSLFSSLAASEVRDISNRVRGLRFRAGEIICFAGQPAHHLFMIEMGEVKRFSPGPTGEPVLMDLLGPGDSFGEQAIVQNSTYTTTAQAMGEVEVWTIDKGDFLGLLGKYPALATTITRLMAEHSSQAQAAPTMRNTGGMPRAPRVPPAPGLRQAPPSSRGVAPRPTGPRTDPSIPPSPSRIQRPLSGARPVAKATARPPAGETADVTRSTPYPRYNAPSANDSTTVVMPRSQVAQVPNDAPTVVMPRSRMAQPRTDESTTIVMPRSQVIRQASRTAGYAAHPAAQPAIRPRRQHGEPNQFLNELVAWITGLSLGAKFRATALTGFFVWFAFITLPVTAISTISSVVGGAQISAPPAPAAKTNVPAATEALTPGRTTTGGMLPKIASARATATPVPTKTRVPPTATRRPTSPPATRAPAQPAAPAAQPTSAVPPTPTVPPLAPAYWDKRLGSGPEHANLMDSVQLAPVTVSSGQKWWRAVSVKWEDINESGNDHTIYVKVLDETGKRIEGKKAHLTSVGGLSEYPDEKPASDLCDCNYNYPMYGDGYAFNIEDQFPSDKVTGMIMPMHRHVNYRVTFQLTTMP